MFKTAHYFFTKKDEEEVSEALLETFPSLKFVDSTHWPTAEPPVVGGIHQCKSGLAYLWPSDLVPTLPCRELPPNLQYGDIKFHGPSAGPVIQFCRCQKKPGFLAFGQLSATIQDNSRADAIPILRGAGASPHLRFVWPETDNANKGFINQTPLELAIQLKRANLVSLLEAPLGAPVPTAVPMTAADVPALWSRIEIALAKATPKTATSLRQGKTQTDHDEAARICGVTFPDDFLASYQIHDGQGRNAGRSFVPERWCDEPYDLLPLKEIAREWSIWKGLLDKGEFRGQQSTPEAGVRTDWWHPGWVPFAGNGGGDFLCVDLAPTDKGRVGQVVEMRHDSNERRRLAGSFADFLREVAERWEAVAAK